MELKNLVECLLFLRDEIDTEEGKALLETLITTIIEHGFVANPRDRDLIRRVVEHHNQTWGYDRA